MERLRQRSDFLAAARGAKVATAGFVLQAVERGDGGPIRIGFTVSKKVGNAPERNRVRRRLKDVVRRSAAERLQSDLQHSGTKQLGLHLGHDYVVIGRRAALQTPFGRLIEDFDGALRRLQRSRAGAPAAKAARPKSAMSETSD